MTKKELITNLTALHDIYDTERGHVDADNLLIEYIDDEDIKKAYDAVSKWYA